MPLRAYLRDVRRVRASTHATEHSYRPALQALLEGLRGGVTATNEPKRRTDCGAPDMVVTKGRGAGGLNIGYIECKDIGVSLDEVAKSDQLKRYRKNLPAPLILTDYLEFRWYVDGDERGRARLAHVSGGKIVAEPGGEEAVADLLGALLDHAPEPISSPRELARRMAGLTRMIRDIIVEGFEQDKVSDTTRSLLDAFEKTLLPQIEPEQFADMFAQTLAYGLFAARVNHTGPAPFDRYVASREIPKTNPFLRDLFEKITGNALDDEPFVGFVDDLANLLASADMGAILADFGARTRQEDPIVHFYETFLAAYDPKLREKRGVYYTPEPVVSYIVRSVDWVLREHFGLAEGLADRSTVEYEVSLPDGTTETRTSPRVLILDPACGTGTFLYHVIDHIRQKFVESNNAGMWPGFVSEHLLPRLFGFELLMAPYAMAHLKLGMQLAGQDMTEAQREKWAYDFPDDQRLNVFLTNTLEEAEQYSQMQFGLMQTIAEEANAASEVKRDMPIMVVLGNPPYYKLGENSGEWIEGLMRGHLPDGTKVPSYYEVDGHPLGEKKLWLQNDYLKFLRFAQWRTTSTGAGVVAMITNHGYLDTPTTRGVRYQLMQEFSDIYILNLHGNTDRQTLAPDGSPDENVFDIGTGVSIVVLVRRPAGGATATVHYAELWGSREAKEERLRMSDASRTEWVRIAPMAPHYRFVPHSGAGREEFEGFASEVGGVFEWSTSGVTTARDSVVVGVDRSELLARIARFRSEDAPDVLLRNEYFGGRRSRKYPRGDTRSWELPRGRADLRRDPDWENRIAPFFYRPFDVRCLYNVSWMVDWPRPELQRHLLVGPNRALLWTRPLAPNYEFSVMLTQHVPDQCAVGRKSSGAGNTYVGPLYLYSDPNALATGDDDLSDSPWPAGENGRRPNLSKEFVDEFAGKLGLEFVSDGRGDLKKTFGPEDIFDYIYAVFHCPTYRERYAEFLKIDFPRVPLTSDADLFRDLVGLGGRLVGLHLMESEELGDGLPSYPVKGDNLVEPAHPKYFPPGEVPPAGDQPLTQGRVYINRTRKKPDAPAQYFEGIEPEVWEFQVGGYQVLGKWLKDRRGRELSPEDLEHYRRVVVALRTTIRIMADIDARIEDWPIE